MNSDQLQIFLRVAATGNLSRTATEMGISQSALSRSISTLERELRTRLFHRSGRGVQLTESGKRLEKHARDVAAILENATRDMSEAIRQGPSNILLAAPPTIARLTFGTIGKALRSYYPGIHVQFREGLGGDIQEWLSSGDIDAAIVYRPTHFPALKMDSLIRDRMYFVAPPSFTRLGDSMPVEQLADHPLVVPSWPNGLRILLDSLVSQCSRSLNVVMECDASVAISKQLVIEECGCTVLSMASVHDEVSRGVLKAVPLVNPDVFREVGILSPQNRPPISSQREVIETVRKAVITLVENGGWVGAQLIR